MPLSNVNIKMS